MTQPAKSQEPSMEEILASIRRIIADDDAGRTVKRASDAPAAPEASEVREAFVQPAVPPPPPFFAPPEPSVADLHAEATADPAATSRAAEEDHGSEILDLTESMTARMFGEPEPAPAPIPGPDAMSEFREPEAAPQEPEPASQFHELEPAPQEPEPASQFHELEPAPQESEPAPQEPEPASQFHELEPAPQEPVPQFHELEPVPQEPEAAPQAQEPDPAPQFHMTENYSDASVEEAAEQPAMPQPSEQSVPYVAPETERRGAPERGVGERGQILSSATSAAVDSAFNALAHTVLVQNARTLEDLVREMLRPMLKTWLDDNLPGMVERLVRAEIERVARGR
jgi:cell pole-organizing protein PopZ